MGVVFLILEIVLVSLDFMLMIVTLGWIPAVKKCFTPPKIYSVPVGSDPSHRVKPGYVKELMRSPPGQDTIYGIQKVVFSTYASSTAMATREFLGMLNPKVKKFGKQNTTTYAEVDRASHKFGAALRSHGLVAGPSVANLKKFETPCSLAIFENTCPEWMIAAMGCFSQSIIVTTIYATLGINGVVDSVNSCVITAIVCNFSNVEILVKNKDKMPSLKTIIFTSDIMAPDYRFEVPNVEGMQVISFEDFVESGNVAAFPPTPPSSTSTAVIMFTSGSTGKPKGVVLSHANICSNVAAFKESTYFEHGTDVYLAYLPLAHIFELFLEFTVFSIGGTVCYADPKTLTSKGAHPTGALEEFSPHIMVGVPKIWDIIKKGVESKIAASSPVAKLLVETAFKARKFASSNGWSTPLFDMLVFKKFTHVIGGRVRSAGSGGGPLNREVQEFIITCFGIELTQGYGLTETCGYCTGQDTDDLSTGTVGAMGAANMVKLESAPAFLDRAGLPYLSTDTVSSDGDQIYGRGEILIKGNNVFIGYYDMPELTAEVVESDGFFHTGDIGQFKNNGTLQIIDRKKNLVKLKGGEYIALENMEMIYGNSSFINAIDGGICVYGDGDMDRPVALMQLNADTVKAWMKERKIEDDYESFKQSSTVYDLVMVDLKREGKKSGLTHLETLCAVAFVDTPWTPLNGGLTAANKINRRVVVAMHEQIFKEVKSKGIF